MRKFKLSNGWYGEDYKLFKKTNVQINPGLTVLVGCNGVGKTTFLNQIKNTLEKEKIPFVFHDNLHEGADKLKQVAGFMGRYDVLANLMMSSEGENIVNVISEITRKMGQLSIDNPDAKELWFLFDAIDSGLSVDNIIEIKEKLISMIINREKYKDVYFLISANEYEFARNENCFDVADEKYIKFKDYEDYREFIIQSRKKKKARYE